MMNPEYEKVMDEFSRNLVPPGFGTNKLPKFSGDAPKLSPNRPYNSHGGATHKRKGVPFVDPQQPALAVAPLNSVPYTGPPLSPVQRQSDRSVSNEPALVFLPSRPDDEEWSNIIAATKRGVGLTGSAARGKVGPNIGLMDIGEGEETYLFRVSLPGVATDKDKFSCDVEPSGKVVMKGVTSTGERKVRRHSQVYEMRTRNLCPPGHFSVSFELPGPVDVQRCTVSFGVDGILEGSVRKRARDGS